MWKGNGAEMESVKKRIDRKKVIIWGIGALQQGICKALILFHRNLLSRLGMFPMLNHKNIGADEEYLCGHCMRNGLSVVVAENAVAGHLSHGSQSREMEKYYHEYKVVFSLKR